MILIVILTVCYLAGSVNFSIIVFRLTGRGDPRNAYSGNPGMTNVYRQCGFPMAALVLVLDMGRSILVAMLAVAFLPAHLVPWAAFGLIVGNRYPVFHDFRGGKGVANYLGFSMYLAPAAAALSAVVWLLVFAFLRKPFLGSFAMIAILTIALIVRCSFQLPCIAGTILTAGFIAYSHKRNVKAWLAEVNHHP